MGAAPIDVAAGAVVTGLVGPLHYGSRTYTVLPDPPSVSPSPVVTGGRQAAPVADPTSAEVTVASFDLQRFYDDSFDFDDEPVLTPEAYAQRLRKASIAIRAFARTPDVVGLQGLENRRRSRSSRPRSTRTRSPPASRTRRTWRCSSRATSAAARASASW